MAGARAIQEALRSRVIARTASAGSARLAGAIGVAKSRLVGTHGPVPEARGTWVPLRDGAETIGAVLRTRAGVRPVYVSIGHRVGLETAIEYVLRCSPRYRLPEPVRRAHALASG